MTITLRQETDARASTKGTSLNFQELDNNFIDILNRTELTVEGDSGSAQLSTASTTDRRLVVNGSGGLTTSITSDSTGQAVLTLTQGAAVVDLVEGVLPGANIDVTADSTGQITVALEAVVDAVEFKDYKETIYSLGTTSGTITPDVANGNVQTITLNGNLTFNAFSNPEAGQSLTLIIDTNGTSRTLTTTMKTPDATDPTMSVTDTIDICTVFYDGTNYYMNYVTNFA